jgi:serine O-acetyltransferase
VYKESKVVKAYRVSNFFYRNRCFFLSRLVTKLIRLAFSAEIPASCIIGENVQFKHGALGVVLHDNLIIGNHCVVYQNVTIGGREHHGTPQIGDNVYIGSGACILGNVKVGDNSKIGANAVVLYDVLAESTVVGIPAKEIHK